MLSKLAIINGVTSSLFIVLPNVPPVTQSPLYKSTVRYFVNGSSSFDSITTAVLSGINNLLNKIGVNGKLVFPIEIASKVVNEKAESLLIVPDVIKVLQSINNKSSVLVNINGFIAPSLTTVYNPF